LTWRVFVLVCAIHLFLQTAYFEFLSCHNPLFLNKYGTKIFCSKLSYFHMLKYISSKNMKVIDWMAYTKLKREFVWTLYAQLTVPLFFFVWFSFIFSHTLSFYELSLILLRLSLKNFELSTKKKMLKLLSHRVRKFKAFSGITKNLRHFYLELIHQLDQLKF
jgi:hypothetical protein